MSPRKIFWKTQFFWKVNPVTVALARLFSHLMKPLQVNSLGECMNGVVHDISANQASRGWAFHTVKQINQWQWCRAVGKSVEKKPLAFCKSEEKTPPVLCCLVTFLSYWYKRENNAEDHLEEDSHFVGPSWWVARNEEKWTKAPSKGQQWEGVQCMTAHHWPIFLGFCESKQSVIVM